MSASQEHLSRSLRSRHVQLIALGGTIGVGLFLGSAKAIHDAGPGLLLSYALVGAVIFFIMRALGELLIHRPVSGSFAAHADEYVGPFAGFVTGWSYWFTWVVTAMAELTAIGIYTHYWVPDIPQFLPALAALLVMYGVNLLAARVFGELEFWFALIKIATILLLIVAGLGAIVFGIGDIGKAASFSNLWSNGGFLPFGIMGVLLTLQIVTFAYAGVELIGVTAGEAQNPSEVLPKAINGVLFRILLFYIGALVVIMALVPWNQLSPSMSPFVFVFDKLGIPAAAHIINAVVITAAASSCNSGIFSTGRMLYNLSLRGQAPKIFGVVNSAKVPAAGIHASAAVMLTAVVLNYLVPAQVFTWITSIAVVGAMWTWGIIMVTHANYRRAVDRGEAQAVGYRMPGAPYINWIVVAFVIAISGMLWIDPGTRVALFVAPIWIALLCIGYAITARRRTERTNASGLACRRPATDVEL